MSLWKSIAVEDESYVFSVDYDGKGDTEASWEKIYDYTLTADAQYIDIDGLHGNEEEVYMVDFRWINVFGSATNAWIRPNNDTAVAHYYSNYLKLLAGVFSYD